MGSKRSGGAGGGGRRIDRPNKPSRAQRVAGRLQAELMELVLRGALREPSLADAYFTEIQLSDDLRHARIYFRLTRPNLGAKDREHALSALDRASGFLRKELGPRLQLQYMPDLKFFWDEGLDRAARIDSILAEIHQGDDDDPKDEGEP
ncbi:MAG TPA: 30S ribosome-binding factor RbfA [Polyangiales bacterium]|nr:30S ribosome-binding factor RbfA [Polyangiales bacterium]